jgi:hypothetical protein
LFCSDFFWRLRTWQGLHTNPDSSKLPPLTREFLDQVRDSLTQQRAGGTAPRKQDEFGRFRSGDPHLCGKRRRQISPDVFKYGELVSAPVQETGERRIG